MKRNLYDVVRRAAELTDSILVGFSGGKDSLVCLDLCSQHFERLELYFLYMVPGLEFQEEYLQWAADRYRAKVHRAPLPIVATRLAGSFLRPYNPKLALMTQMKQKDVEDYLREQSGIDWIATGERASDSLERRGMITKCQGVDVKRKRIFPCAWFTPTAIFGYIKLRNLRLAPEYRFLKHSFGRIDAETLVGIKKYYPQDYEKILEFYPYAEALVAREAFSGQARKQAGSGDGLPEIRQA